jgi:hypothetical protein
MGNSGDGSSPSGDSGSWWSRMSRSEQIIAAVVGAIILGVFGVVAALISRSSGSSQAGPSGTDSPVVTSSSPVVNSPPTPSKTSPNSRTIKIIKPASESYVNLNNNVKIQVSGVGMSRQVWLLVRLGPKVYPQGPCDTFSLTVTVCPHVRFGDPGLPFGTLYKVTAVLVNNQDSRKYRSYVEPGFNNQSAPVSPILSSPSITVHGRE